MFTLIFLILLGGVNVSADEKGSEVTESELNGFLHELNVPLNVIENLSYSGKLKIYNTIDEDAVFDGYNNEDVYLPTDGNILPLTIPKSQLELKVSAFKNSDGTYSIYPSFIWKQKARLKNDSFGFVLDYSNWTTV